MIVKLEISSFTFIGSFNAEHFYGKLKWTQDNELKEIEIKKPLSQKEAVYLNEKDEAIIFSRHKKGELSDRFETEAEVEKWGIKEFKNRFDKTKDILMLGSYGCCSAEPIVVGPPQYKKEIRQLNNLAAEWEKIGGYEGNAARANKIDTEFQSILDKIK